MINFNSLFSSGLIEDEENRLYIEPYPVKVLLDLFTNTQSPFIQKEKKNKTKQSFSSLPPLFPLTATLPHPHPYPISLSLKFASNELSL